MDVGGAPNNGFEAVAGVDVAGVAEDEGVAEDPKAGGFDAPNGVEVGGAGWVVVGGGVEPNAGVSCLGGAALPNSVDDDWGVDVPTKRLVVVDGVDWVGAPPKREGVDEGVPPKSEEVDGGFVPKREGFDEGVVDDPPPKSEDADEGVD